MVKIVGLGIISTILAVVLRQEKPELALLLSVGAGLIILSFVVPKIAVIVEVLNRLAAANGVNNIYLNTILKVVGISYITGFGCSIASEAGEEVIAKKILLAGRVTIIALGIPIMLAILESLMELLY